MNAIAVIPARGGSKGVPRKNVRPLCGKPLIAWSIEAARMAASVKRIVVSTDDPEIAEVSKAWGAEVVWRPKEMSGDTSPSEVALLHTLDQLQVRHGRLVFLQCTSPLLLAADIDGTVRALEAADTAFTATLWHGFLWKEARGEAMPIDHDKGHRPMRQQLEAAYVEVGAVYAMRVEGLIATRHRFHGKTAMYPIPAERAIEIDEEIDFTIAEALMRRRLSQEKQLRLPRPVQALVMDFDGVLTDNRVRLDERGIESVACHRGDGWAIQRFKELGMKVVVLTNEANPVVQKRCEKLGVECLVAPGEKLPVLLEWSRRHDVDLRHTVYVGNDVPDAPCMLRVGCGIAPSDASREAMQAALIVLESRGGEGCVRELADLIIAERGGAR